MPQICQDISLPLCENCYETITVYDTTINFLLDLTAGDIYYLFIIDKFGNVFRNLTTIQPDGSVQIDILNYPDGFFNQYAGIFKLFLSSDENGIDIIPFTIDSVIYTCIIFEIYDLPYIIEAWFDEDGNLLVKMKNSPEKIDCNISNTGALLITSNIPENANNYSINTDGDLIWTF